MSRNLPQSQCQIARLRPTDIGVLVLALTMSVACAAETRRQPSRSAAAAAHQMYRVVIPPRLMISIDDAAVAIGKEIRPRQMHVMTSTPVIVQLASKDTIPTDGRTQPMIAWDSLKAKQMGPTAWLIAPGKRATCTFRDVPTPSGETVIVITFSAAE
jgi:hypothetical protein